MAHSALRLAGNIEGPLFVDSHCIDCETCRFLAPSLFVRSQREASSVVARQPSTAEERAQAAQALVACPTSAIGMHPADKALLRGAAHGFPLPIDEEVSYCGFAAESSFGAASYFIQRREGNVLIDSPRASKILMDRLEALGGVRFLFLSHRDDVADHAEYRKRFGCERILHVDDVTADTRDVERAIEGHSPVPLGPDLLLIPTPGHTRGSSCLLYRGRYLFTGDHLWADENSGQLDAGRSVCWYSWAEQKRSMRGLLDFDFEWVLPGHGRRFQTRSALEMRDRVQELVERM